MTKRKAREMIKTIRKKEEKPPCVELDSGPSFSNTWGSFRESVTCTISPVLLFSVGIPLSDACK